MDPLPVPSDPASQIASALGRLDLASISGSSLTTRGKLVEMHAQLEAIERIVHDRKVMIEMAFIRAGVEQSADQIRTSAGVVTLKPEPGKYETRAQAMRQELDRLIVDGVLSKEELEEACPVTVSYGVNHTRLNYLASHRGEAVREVIDRNRAKVPPDPLRAKPVFPKVKEEDNPDGKA